MPLTHVSIDSEIKSKFNDFIKDKSLQIDEDFFKKCELYSKFSVLYEKAMKIKNIENNAVSEYAKKINKQLINVKDCCFILSLTSFLQKPQEVFFPTAIFVIKTLNQNSTHWLNCTSN